MNTPLVSVICLAYNHEEFVEEAIRSVQHQTYPNIELIVIDDHSTDSSASVIRRILPGLSNTHFISLPSNLGNCKAFNQGLKQAKGDFVIDLSADDLLLPQRVEKGVHAFQQAGDNVGVNFTDAELIDKNGETLGFHSERFPHPTVPQGNIYAEVLSRYFINSPSMMIRKKVFDTLDGYDESLAYEDFDFWVRSARLFDYSYIPDVLIKNRVLYNSLGNRQYRRGSKQLRSTLKVCEKAFEINKTRDEHEALKKRIYYELRQAIRLGELRLARDYWRLLRRKVNNTFGV
ncbi:MAG: glycosyltransferase [Bacteroidota bacterium]